MSQFNKYIKIATEIINEANGGTNEPDMDKKLRLLTNIIKKYTELIENETIDGSDVVINDIVKGEKNDGKHDKLGFVSDFDIDPSKGMINAGRSAVLNKNVIQKQNDLYYKGNLQLTETLVNKLQNLKTDDLEKYLGILEDTKFLETLKILKDEKFLQKSKTLKTLSDVMKKIGNL